jgi:hypothetical protein
MNRRMIRLCVKSQEVRLSIPVGVIDMQFEACVLSLESDDNAQCNCVSSMDAFRPNAYTALTRRLLILDLIVKSALTKACAARAQPANSVPTVCSALLCA